MFRGSPGLSAGQLATLMAAMGGRSDADTQQTVTQYFFTVPSEDLDLPLHIEAIRMKGVLDSQKLWEEERGAIEQEVARDFSNPMYIFYSRLLKKMFAGTPYAHDALGTRPSFNKTTGAMLQKFHRTWYAPNNAVLVIAGDVDPARTLATVKRLFGKIPSRPLPARSEFALKPLQAGTIRTETDLPYGMAVVAYRLPGYDSPDFAASQVMADVLNSQRARMYELVTNGRALFAEFDAETLPKAGLGYAVAAFPKGKNGLDLVAALKGIIHHYVKIGFPSDLVEASKRREIADAQFQKNSIEGLADAWSQAVAVEGRYSPEEDILAIKKVTVADVDRVARRYLLNEKAVVGLLTPGKAGKPTRMGHARGRESFTPKQAKPVSLPKWAQKALSLKSLPTSGVKPAVSILPNGLRLIVQRETISPTISVYGQVKNNPKLEESKGEEGVSDVLDDLFSYGTTTLNRLSFRKAVDDIAADLEVGESFSLQVLADHFDRGVELLADNLLHPALPLKAFKVVQKETAAAIAGRLESPSYLAKRALLTGLYPKKDPSLREATPTTVGSLTLADVKTYYKMVFRPDLTTVVVIGDVTPEKAKEIILKYLGNWKAVGAKPRTDLPPVPLNKSSATVVPDATRLQDEVILMETMGMTRSNPAYYPLQLGLHVLSGGFYATRLYRDLREKTGLVYTVEAFLEAHKTRSVFGVVYGCDPPNVSKARLMIVRDLREMQTAPVTPAELEQARRLLIRQIPLSQSSTDSIAEQMLTLSMEGLPLDEPILAAKRYKALTASDVQKAFAEWIRPKAFVQVVRGPNPK